METPKAKGEKHSGVLLNSPPFLCKGNCLQCKGQKCSTCCKHESHHISILCVHVLCSLMWVCSCARGGSRPTFTMFPDCLPPTFRFWDKISHSSWGCSLVKLGWPHDKFQRSSCLWSPNTGVTETLSAPLSFSLVPGELNLGPYSYLQGRHFTHSPQPDYIPHGCGMEGPGIENRAS